ncbi:hypothetical protein [Salinicoccus halitifaciens]|uniref:Nitrogen fixation-related uncharacterized protein n=1 Tax=Salinicoccus halitifaciens TaxID=1073415 RepID=A0ABV2EB86_9STAP|nr:hypothetical protein [Salinicoccus halitifaciens]MCD2137489.1 hypothetical protein [Salinicoccus halitifaciens]
MKKILLVVALILFAGGLYVNFMAGPSAEQSDSMDEAEPAEDIAGDDAEEQEEAPEDDSGSAEETEHEEAAAEESDPEVAFNQESLDELHEEAVENNEALIIDVLLPDYYSDDFTENLEDEFGTETIQFNRLTLDANTTELSEVGVNENSDAVIIDALQIRDYDDGVERDLEALSVAYRNVYDNDKVVFLLGNPNVDPSSDLESVLSEDEAYFAGNDYYYIDNQDVRVEDSYDEDEEVMAPAVENEVTRNIYDYLISES